MFALFALRRLHKKQKRRRSAASPTAFLCIFCIFLYDYILIIYILLKDIEIKRCTMDHHKHGDMDMGECSMNVSLLFVACTTTASYWL